MRIFPSITTWVLVVSAVAIGSLTARADELLVDGNFASASDEFLSAGQTFGNGAWLVTQGSVDLILSSYWQVPSAGGGSIDLDGATPGQIEQDFVAPSAGEYVLTFALSGNPGNMGRPNPKVLNVSVADASQTYSYTVGSNSYADMAYVYETLSFYADQGVNRLIFTSLDSSGANGPVIGDVSIQSDTVPEPAAWPLLAAGLVGATRLRRRKEA